MNLVRATSIILLAAASAACGRSEGSINLIFPNTVAREATLRLRVEAYNPNAAGTGSSDRDCTDFMGLAAQGTAPLGTPVRGDFQCQAPCADDWIQARGLEVEKVPKGEQIVYVLAFASNNTDAAPVLEGCTDKFDSGGGSDEAELVDIDLQYVLPENTRLEKVSGDRQVGRAGETLPAPLVVVVRTESPGTERITYEIPGVPVIFSSEADGFELLDDPNRNTDVEGLAEMTVKLSPGPGEAIIKASAPLLKAESVTANQEEVEFSVSVTSGATLMSSRVIEPPAPAFAVDAVVGDIVGGTEIDLAVLSCTGGTRENCAPGHDAVAPYGDGRLIVFDDLNGNAVARSPMMTEEFGILPAGAVATQVMIRPRTQIAVVNSRRKECQARGCEGAEVLLFSDNTGTFMLDSRETMTASNAVGITEFRHGTDDLLAVAGQGRKVDDLACEMGGSLCLPEGQGGCPAGERCDRGFCRADDKMVDFVSRNASAPDTVVNQLGCQAVTIDCNKSDPTTSGCTCDDTRRGNQCDDRGSCGCHLPHRVHFGSMGTPIIPYGVAADQMTIDSNWDFVAATNSGLGFIEHATALEDYEWAPMPLVETPIHGVVVADMDTVAEAGGPNRPDVVWYARKKCLVGENYGERCPFQGSEEDLENSIGCMGVFHTDGARSVFDVVSSTEQGGCRKYPILFRPTDACAGDFNGDGRLDVALTAGDADRVFVMSGDGRGGLLNPPAEFSLPSQRPGGRVVCEDLDRNGVDDLIVIEDATSTINVLYFAN